VRIGIISDFTPEPRYHHATSEPIRHASLALASPVEISWLPTPDSEGVYSTASPKTLPMMACDALQAAHMTACRVPWLGRAVNLRESALWPSLRLRYTGLWRTMRL
jgi:hypothetical protein